MLIDDILGFEDAVEKSALVRVGGNASATFADTSYGYDLTGLSDNGPCYLATPISGTDKVAWEVVIADSWHYHGIVTEANKGANDANGGRSGKNAGLYSPTGGLIWNALGGVTDHASGIYAGTAGRVWGFAVDWAAKTMAVRLDNTLSYTLDISAAGTAVYPMFGFRMGTPSIAIRIGSGLIYGPPSGFSAYN